MTVHRNKRMTDVLLYPVMTARRCLIIIQLNDCVTNFSVGELLQRMVSSAGGFH